MVLCLLPALRPKLSVSLSLSPPLSFCFRLSFARCLCTPLPLSFPFSPSTPSRERRLRRSRADAYCSVRYGHLSLTATFLQRAHLQDREQISVAQRFYLALQACSKERPTHASSPVATHARGRQRPGRCGLTSWLLRGAGQLSAVISIRQGKENHDAGHVPCRGLPSPLPGPAGVQHMAAAGTVDDATPAFSKATRTARVSEGADIQKMP